MTKVQRADALLWAARWWQQGLGRPDNQKVKYTEMAWDVAEESDLPYDRSASTALSEVGSEINGLGFDLEDVEAWDRESKIWRKT